MRIFKQIFRDRRTGENRESTKWYVGIIVGGDERRIPAFTDKRASEEFGRKLDDMAAFKAARRALPPDFSRWLDSLPAKVRQRLAKHGLLDPESEASFKSLIAHLDDYRQYLEGAGRTPDYVQKSFWRIKRIIDGIGAQLLSDIQPQPASRFLTECRLVPRNKGGLSAKSLNHYLGSIKGFCTWMVRERRVSDNPLACLKNVNVTTDRKHVRRALDSDEIRALLRRTRSSLELHGMSGDARYWLYRLAVETGLRSGELRSLTRASFDLCDPRNATVTLAAKSAKNRKEATLPIRPATATELTEHLADKLPLAAAFNMPRPEKVVVMFRADLAAAGIDYVDEAGRVADFHSLRKSFATMLVRAGVDIRTARDLMRHSTIAMTADVYAVRVRGADADAVANLPDFGVPVATEARATGTTCLPSCLPDCLPGRGAHAGAPVQADSHHGDYDTGMQDQVDASDIDENDDEEGLFCSVGAVDEKPPPRGFEPLSPA